MPNDQPELRKIIGSLYPLFSPTLPSTTFSLLEIAGP